MISPAQHHHAFSNPTGRRGVFGFLGLVLFAFVVLMALWLRKELTTGLWGFRTLLVCLSALSLCAIGATALISLMRKIYKEEKLARTLGNPQVEAEVRGKAGLVAVTESRDERRTCVYCREGFDHRPVMLCPLCETRLHPDCWSELDTCPTLGCEGNRRSEKARSPSLKDRI